MYMQDSQVAIAIGELKSYVALLRKIYERSDLVSLEVYCPRLIVNISRLRSTTPSPDLLPVFRLATDAPNFNCAFVSAHEDTISQHLDAMLSITRSNPFRAQIFSLIMSITLQTGLLSAYTGDTVVSVCIPITALETAIEESVNYPLFLEEQRKKGKLPRQLKIKIEMHV
jgi:hypothetical protein